MNLRKAILPTLALFGSFSTLICCALPALLVSLGAGAVVIGLVGAVPQLVFLSEHKVALFIISGIMLMLSGISRYMSRAAACPADKEKAAACGRLKRWSSGIFYFSLILYLVGFFFAFIAEYLV